MALIMTWFGPFGTLSDIFVMISEQTSQDEFSYVTVTICIYADAYKLVLTSYIMGDERELSNSEFVLKNWFHIFWA